MILNFRVYPGTGSLRRICVNARNFTGAVGRISESRRHSIAGVFLPLKETRYLDGRVNDRKFSETLYPNRLESTQISVERPLGRAHFREPRKSGAKVV